MIIDLRMYTMVPGRLGAFLRRYEEGGLPVQVRHQGQPFGYFVTEIGTNNQVVHLWRYEDMADRERRRAALEADPEWAIYRAGSAAEGNVQHQANQILRPAPFFREHI